MWHPFISDLTLEIFHKSCCGLKLLPLNGQRDFLLLYSGQSVVITKQRHKTTGPFSTLHQKSSSTHINTNKTVANATLTGKSTNRANKNSETQVKFQVPSTAILSSSALSSTIPLQQTVELPLKEPSLRSQKHLIPKAQEAPASTTPVKTPAFSCWASA